MFAPAYMGRKRWAQPNHGFLLEVILRATYVILNLR